MQELFLFSMSAVGGFIGALLGLGGGLIVVPVLTLGLGIHIRYAIAASLISIVATSSGAAARYLQDRLSNVRLAVLLEVGTVLGAMTGFLISKHIRSDYLFVLFGVLLLVSAISMFRNKSDARAEHNHAWTEYLNLSAEQDYKIANVPGGLLGMYFAGILSSLLGIGSGLFKVLAMDGLMKLPMKVSSATSNFMIGVTAAASAGAYLLSGDIRPEIACPVSVGIVIGSWFGAGVMPKMPAERIRKIFVVVLFIVSVQMIAKGFRR